MAAHILFARRRLYARPPSAERVAEMQAWYDRHLKAYFDFVAAGTEGDLSRLFIRGLSFVALSLDCMIRATGEDRYREGLKTAVELILRAGDRSPCGRDEHDLAFVDAWDFRVPFLDSHSTCVMALARASTHGDPDGMLSQAVSEAILAMKLHTGPFDLGGGHTLTIDNLAVRPPLCAASDLGSWNFKLGLALRALHMVERAAEAGHIQLNEVDRERVALRRDLCQRWLERSLRPATAPDGTALLELLTSRMAGETNSETQPWGALGLFPVVDEMIMSLAPPA